MMPFSTAMFQLVLQFEVHELDDFDQLVMLEGFLSDRLHPGAKVDGHDMGMGEFNIFILTRTPSKAFEQAKSVVVDRYPDRTFKAAYRALDAERYVVVWPLGLQHFEVS
jgi:hypothetical protein